MSETRTDTLPEHPRPASADGAPQAAEAGPAGAGRHRGGAAPEHEAPAAEAAHGRHRRPSAA